VGLGDGLGIGVGVGAGEGDGCGGEGLGDGEGLVAVGDPLGDADGVPLGDAVGVDEQPWVPLRKISCDWAPHPCTIPDGCVYQLRILVGSALTKRAMIVWPTLSPKALIMPPPPLGAVLPTQTPATMSGL
jgi:hypothetical protein